MTDARKSELSASRQIRFHQLLVAARKVWLLDALFDALKTVDPKILKADLARIIPSDAQQILASAGIRDEQVFPAPSLLRAAPQLVGYYRLLLGLPQKTFYGSGHGMTRFKTMEIKGILTRAQENALEEFCTAMAEPLAELVRQLSPTMSQRDVQELPLLTLGSQFQGSNNNIIGKAATVEVFLSIAEIVAGYIVSRGENQIVIENSAGRMVVVRLASDPDVSIEEQSGQTLRRVVAIEIKGGTDKSNAHNRAGEAEKSHQKARSQGYRDYWTIISTRGLDLATLKGESPTTNAWFDVAQILAREGSDYREFVENLSSEVGIPVMDKLRGSKS